MIRRRCPIRHRAALALALAVALIASALVSSSPVAADPDTLDLPDTLDVPDTIDVIVVNARGTPLLDAVVSAAGQTATTDRYGRVQLSGVGAPPLQVTVSHISADPVVTTWSGVGDRLVVPVARPVIRAIHVSGTLPGTSRWEDLLQLADSTSLNAFMLDVKDESGRVFPTTDSSWAVQAGAASNLWDLAGVTADLHARGLRVVVRIVTFQDPIAGSNIPSMAATTTGGSPYSKGGQVFLDPTDPDARNYALGLAEQACDAGVDEVQFDYVRFPDGSLDGVNFDGGKDEATRVEAITSFLAEARDVVGDCDVAADIFGFITMIEGDGGIGQQLETLAAVTDVLSPMVYPNHWSTGWFGFAEPADHPGEVVDMSSRNAMIRTAASGVTIRPWIQDFDGYSASQVRAQALAADWLGLGWMIWNAGSVFTTGGIPQESELITPAEAPAPYGQFLPFSGFYDVADGTTFGADVRWLGLTGITNGCNPPWRDEFCPKRILTRGEAAAFLARALDLPVGTPGRFTDDDESTHEADIERIAEARITVGCAPDRFCPDRPVTRAEMAALIARALDLPVGTPGRFTDDDESTHEADIERIAEAGITVGCAADRFCPDDQLTRDQLAAFLHRALT